MRSSNALCLFIKAPIAGSVKTRMQPQLSAGQSLGLYKAMAEDLVEHFKDQSGFDLLIFYSPREGEADIINWLGDDLNLVPQSGLDLGEKMNNAFLWSSKNKYMKTLIIGSDLPAVNADLVKQAMSDLDSCDVILGPTTDGGYYLIGQNRPTPELFAGIAWSSDTVYDMTLERINETALKMLALPKMADLDSYSDVLQFWSENEFSIDKTHMRNTGFFLRKLFRNFNKEFKNGN